MTAPLSYAAVALYGLDIERAVPDFMEEYERAEDSAREREEAEAEANSEMCFTHPSPLADFLE